MSSAIPFELAPKLSLGISSTAPWNFFRQMYLKFKINCFMIPLAIPAEMLSELHSKIPLKILSIKPKECFNNSLRDFSGIVLLKPIGKYFLISRAILSGIFSEILLAFQILQIFLWILAKIFIVIYLINKLFLHLI